MPLNPPSKLALLIDQALAKKSFKAVFDYLSMHEINQETAKLIARVFNGERCAGGVYEIFSDKELDREVSGVQGFVEDDAEDAINLAQKLFHKREVSEDEVQKANNFIAFLRPLKDADKLLNLLDFLFSNHPKTNEEVKDFLQRIIPDFIKTEEPLLEEYLDLLLSMTEEEALKNILGVRVKTIEEAAWFLANQCQMEDISNIFADKFFLPICMKILESAEQSQEAGAESFFCQLGEALIEQGTLFSNEPHAVSFKLELARRVITLDPAILSHFEKLLILDNDGKIATRAVDLISVPYAELSDLQDRKKFIGNLLDLACKIYGNQIVECKFEPVPSDLSYEVPVFDKKHPDLFFSQAFLLIEMRKLGLEKGKDFAKGEASEADIVDSRDVLLEDISGASADAASAKPKPSPQKPVSEKQKSRFCTIS